MRRHHINVFRRIRFFPCPRVECTTCTSYPRRYSLPVAFTCTRNIGPPFAHTTKS